jgi:hypothetical protein
VALKLYPHQEDAVAKMHDGCVLTGDVGSGKSLTAAAYYKRTHAVEKLDIYVITTARKRDSLDWQKEFARFAIGKTREDSIAGRLVVDSWNNIEKYKSVKNSFFIFDEQRLVGSGKWVKSFLFLAKRNKWIMLSATPGDTWMDYAPLFIANGFYTNKTEFVNKHVVYSRFTKYPKIDRYEDEGTLIKHRASILVDMPFHRKTVRMSENVKVAHNLELLKEIVQMRWNPFEQVPVKDVSDMFRLMRKATYTDPSRLEAVRGLVQKHPRLIVFYNFDYELEILRGLADEVPVAEWNGHKHEEVPTSERWVYLVQYTAGSEAWNCITTNAMCFYSLPYSYKQWHQAHGRIDRLNTDFSVLFYYSLLSLSKIDVIVARSLRAKRSFNEAAFIRRVSKT